MLPNTTKSRYRNLDNPISKSHSLCATKNTDAFTEDCVIDDDEDYYLTQKQAAINS